MLYNFLVFYDEESPRQLVCDLESGRTAWASKSLKIAHIEVQDKKDVEEVFKDVVGFTHRIIHIQESNYEQSS